MPEREDTAVDPPPLIALNNCVVNVVQGNNIRESGLGMNNGDCNLNCDGNLSSFDSTGIQQTWQTSDAIASLKALKYRNVKRHNSQRYFVPMVKNRAIKITIEYPDGKKQNWINEIAKTGDTIDETHVIQSSNEGRVEIMFLYENGDVQVEVFRKGEENFTYFSKTGKTQLNVTNHDGVVVEVKPGYSNTFTTQIKDGKTSSLVLKGEHGNAEDYVGEWLINGYNFDEMYLPDDFNSTIEQHCKDMLLSLKAKMKAKDKMTEQQIEKLLKFYSALGKVAGI